MIAIEKYSKRRERDYNVNLHDIIKLKHNIKEAFWHLKTRMAIEQLYPAPQFRAKGQLDEHGGRRWKLIVPPTIMQQKADS